MANYDLSILIPARNEMFLAKTVENILENIQGNTEVIAVMDGYWAEPPIAQHERVTIVHNPEPLGQRASTNLAARLSSAKYVMKCDAHCAFDTGFDIKMIQGMHDDWTMVPTMKNLHAFDWVCPDGHRRYQGPSGPCKECGKETVRDILWQAKPSPNSVSYCFDSTPHFQYFGDFAKRPEGQGEITETMSLQGSCWMLTGDKYWELGVCDENFGIWGSQGIEVAVKTWLSGGKVMVNKKTWYAHMFRTQGGDFGFPYEIKGSDQEKAKSTARDLFFNNKWDKQIRPLSWLIEKFWPIKGWTDEDLARLKANTFRFSDTALATKPAESLSRSVGEADWYRDEPDGEVPLSGIIYEVSTKPEPKEEPTKLKKGIVFYTDNMLNLKIAHAVQRQLKKISDDKKVPIVSSSLKKMTFGDKNVHFPHLKRSYLTMFKQILGALEASSADIIFFCEHDVIYHPSHFDFIPERRDVYYYNVNVWKLHLATGHAVHYDCQQTSGLCAYRDLLLQHYRERIRRIEAEWDHLPHHELGRYRYSMGFEPGTHGRPQRIDDYKAENWKSEFPNIDIRHGENMTKFDEKLSLADFKDKNHGTNWMETDDEIPGWGNIKEFIRRFRLKSNSEATEKVGK